MKAYILVFVVLVSIVFTVPLSAALTCTNTASTFAVAGGGYYTFNVYARRTSAGVGGPNEIKVGISSFLFDVDQTGGFNFTVPPVLSNVNAKYTSADGSVNDYGPITAQWSHTSVYKVNITINFTGNNVGAGVNMSTTDELICTVALKISNGTKTASIAWDQVASAITTSNSAPCTNSFAGADNSVLPVELASFKVSANNLGSQLNWSTASEVNNYGFDVERRTVSNQPSAVSSWAKIGFVNGNGTSNVQHSYSFSDNVSESGTYAYRLKQYDNNGSFKYSQSTQVTIEIPKVFTLNQNYPNPFNPTTNIDFSVAANGKAVLKVYNILGQEVAELYNGEAQAGKIIQTHFDASRLASGIYFSRLEADGKSLVKRMMFVK